MIISTTDKSIRIQYGNEIYTHPMNSISYAINEDTTGITFFRNGEPIGTAPLKKTTVNGVELTSQNLDSVLSDLFFTN